MLLKGLITMSKLYIPEGYSSELNLRQTQCAIKKVKDFFERDLAMALNLTRVSAPLLVTKESGLQDDLSGVERKVSFDILKDYIISLTKTI